MYICGKIFNIKRKKQTMFILLKNETINQVVVKKDIDHYMSSLRVGDVVECNVLTDKNNIGKYNCEYPSYLLNSIKVISKNIANLILDAHLDCLLHYSNAKFRIRKFLYDNGYLEINPPILTNGELSSRAKSFVTSYTVNGNNTTLFLRKTMDIFLRIYSCCGVNKIYALGNCFRNEALTSYNKPEFEMLSIFTNYMSQKEAINMAIIIINTITLQEFNVKYISEFDYKNIIPQDDILYVITDYKDSINSYSSANEGNSNEFKLKYKGVTVVHGVDEIFDFNEYDKKISKQGKKENYGELNVVEKLINSGSPKCYNLGISIIRILSLYYDIKIKDFNLLSFDRLYKWRNI